MDNIDNDFKRAGVSLYGITTGRNRVRLEELGGDRERWKDMQHPWCVLHGTWCVMDDASKWFRYDALVCYCHMLSAHSTMRCNLPDACCL